MGIRRATGTTETILFRSIGSLTPGGQPPMPNALPQ